MKPFLILSAILFFHIGYSQTTYTIDFSYETINSNCNVFSSEVTIDNFKHQTTKGFPTFSGATSYYVNLPCKRNSQSSQLGTEYQVLFPFKKDYKYTINVQYKGTVSNSNELYPQVALKLNETKKTHNTSTSCSGPQSVTLNDYDAFGASGSSLAWAANPIYNGTTALTKNYESLSVGSFPWPNTAATGTQSIQIRAIQIVETPPPAAAVITGVVKLNPGSDRGVEDGEATYIRADYTLASPIPESDLAFDWRLKKSDNTVAPYQSNVFFYITNPTGNPWNFASELNNAGRSAYFTAQNPSYDYSLDSEVYVQVRMKQISTNTYLTDWYTATPWFYIWW